MLSLYNDPETAITVAAERSFLGALNGGCQIPIGAFASLVPSGTSAPEAESRIELTGLVGSPDGNVILKENAAGSDPQLLGEEVASILKSKGAEEILSEVRG
ncbi:Porphobilinogen deaminase [compost metagenome]